MRRSVREGSEPLAKARQVSGPELLIGLRSSAGCLAHSPPPSVDGVQRPLVAVLLANRAGGMLKGAMEQPMSDARSQPTSQPEELTAHDRGEIARARRAGQGIGSPVPVTHFFFSPGVYPVQAVAALRGMGIDDVVVDEEVSGDRYWHVTAFHTLALTAGAIAEAKREMGRVATQADVRYDGWRVALLVGEELSLGQ